jgi:hypothetical protein
MVRIVYGRSIERPSFPGNKKILSMREFQEMPLIFQTHLRALDGIGTVLTTGCRGFTGPFPPPLWMSVQFYSVAEIL